METMELTEQIARVAYETERAYCQTIGDDSQKPWDEAEPWQRDSAIKRVEFALAHPGAPVSAEHDAWLKDKEAAGWAWGHIKDPINRLDPRMVPFHRLPLEQRMKDCLFRGIAFAFQIMCIVSGEARGRQ